MPVDGQSPNPKEGTTEEEASVQDANPEGKRKGLISGFKSKLEEVKKQWAPKINEKLVYVTNSLSNSDSEVHQNDAVIPQPREACNWVMRRLLETKNIETQPSQRVRQQAASIVNILNQRNIDII